MSVKPLQNLFIKLVTIVLIFLYLHLVLWSVLLHPTIDIDVSWLPKSLFSSTKQQTCIIRLHRHTPMVMLESIFFSLIALFGYFCGCGGCMSYRIYGTTLATFEQSMMGVRQKYYWLCFLPWIITFILNWFQNVGALLMLFSSSSSSTSISSNATSLYEALNALQSVIILLVFLCVQALLASEVMCMALQGWQAMKNINDENMLWEQKKRFLDGDTLNTVFGLMR